MKSLDVRLRRGESIWDVGRVGKDWGGRRPRWEPLDVSDLCRWSFSVVSESREPPPRRQRRLFAQQQIVSHMVLCRGRGGSAPRGDARLIPGVAWTLFFFASVLLPKPCDTAAGAHMSRPGVGLHAPTLKKTQPLLHRRVANWEKRIKAFEIRSCYKTSSHARLSSGPVADRKHFEDGSKWNKLFLKRAPHRIWLPNHLSVTEQL